MHAATDLAPALGQDLEVLRPFSKLRVGDVAYRGQAPSVHPEYADLLVRAGIDCISVNIDVVDRTRELVAAAERRVLLDAARS